MKTFLEYIGDFTNREWIDQNAMPADKIQKEYLDKFDASFMFQPTDDQDGKPIKKENTITGGTEIDDEEPGTQKEN